MWQKKIKPKIQKIIASPKTFMVLALIVFIALIFPLSKNIGRRYRINQEIKGLEQEIKDTENKNTELQKLIEYLNSDQFVEEQARLNLGLKKPGEEVVVVKGVAGSPQLASEDSEKDEGVFNIPGLEKAREKEVINNPERWFYYFAK